MGCNISSGEDETKSLENHYKQLFKEKLTGVHFQSRLNLCSQK